jgi:hypothetical protein
VTGWWFWCPSSLADAHHVHPLITRGKRTKPLFASDAKARAAKQTDGPAHASHARTPNLRYVPNSCNCAAGLSLAKAHEDGVFCDDCKVIVASGKQCFSCRVMHKHPPCSPECNTHNTHSRLFFLSCSATFFSHQVSTRPWNTELTACPAAVLRGLPSPFITHVVHGVHVHWPAVGNQLLTTGDTA